MYVGFWELAADKQIALKWRRVRAISRFGRVGKMLFEKPVNPSFMTQ